MFLLRGGSYITPKQCLHFTTSFCTRSTIAAGKEPTQQLQVPLQLAKRASSCATKLSFLVYKTQHNDHSRPTLTTLIQTSASGTSLSFPFPGTAGPIFIAVAMTVPPSRVAACPQAGAEGNLA
jgi:hypothetical protein